MKRFYALLAVVAAAGVGFLLWQMNKSSTPAVPVAVTIQPSDTAGFRGYVLGSDTAPVEIVEYADYQCPACQQFATVEWPYVRDRLVQTGRVRWVFKDFPLQQHQWARLAAHSAACANDQGKFWEYADAVFATQPDWSASRDAGKIFREQAEKVGLNAAAWDQCMSALKFAGHRVVRGYHTRPYAACTNRAHTGHSATSRVACTEPCAYAATAAKITPRTA